MKGSGIPVGNKTKAEILSNLPKDVNGNLLRSLAIKVLQQVLNASNVPAPLATAASAPTHPSPGSSTKAARSQMTNPKFPSSKKVTLDAPVESGNRVIDRGCMKNYEVLGYTPEMIAFLGYCSSS